MENITAFTYLANGGEEKVNNLNTFRDYSFSATLTCGVKLQQLFKNYGTLAKCFEEQLKTIQLLHCNNK